MYTMYVVSFEFVVCVCVYGSDCFLFFFFKQKTAYEMRISDWSSDVCSSDLEDISWRDINVLSLTGHRRKYHFHVAINQRGSIPSIFAERLPNSPEEQQIGRASCRERVCQ